MIQGNRGELLRDTKNGKIAGVCAGLANYFGWETWLVRIIVLSAVLMGAGFLILFYIAGWFILDKKADANSSREAKSHGGFKSRHNMNPSDEQLMNESIRVKAKIWQKGEPAKQAFYDIRRKFEVMEQQLRQMEYHVTSPEFTVSREINKL